MSPEQIVDLLSLMVAFDRRTVGEADVHAWHAAIGDLPYDDARRAVIRHYRESEEWLKPARVRKLVRAIRDERLSAEPIPAPPAELADSPEAYRQALARILHTVGDGRMPFRAIEGPRPTAPPPEYQALRTEEDRLRVLVKSVPCPVDGCSAKALEPCRVRGTGEELSGWHPARQEAAVAAREGEVTS